MENSAHRSWYLAASVGLSLVVHFLLYGLFGCLPFLPRTLRDTPRVPSRTIRLTEVRLPEPPATPAPRRAELVPLPRSVEAPPVVPGVPAGGHGGEATASPDDARPRPELPERAISPVTIPMAPGILQIDGDRLPPARAEFNRLIVPRIPREAGALVSPSAPGIRSAPPAPPIPLAMRVSPPVPSPVGPRLPVTPETRLLPPEQVAILDRLIEVRMVKQELPDGHGFFRIDLTPREGAAQLQSWRKDVVFLIDVSGSISQVKLNEYRQGIKLALAQMPPEDRFEIIAFRHREYSLFGELRHPTADNLVAADEFLFKLQRVGSTNIYAALQRVTDGQLKTPGRPLLVFFCSDGQVNFGEIVDSSRLINAIANRNQYGISIFGFEAGSCLNPFLMDLLAYRNRGETKHTNQVAGSRQALSQFVTQVSDVVVADLEYQVSSHLADGVFPKQLPHLYRDHTLSIHGRYSPGTHDIGLRIVGTDSSGQRQELIWRGELGTASQAGDLVQNWAMQRIYHLYSRLTATGDEQLRHDIRAVAQEHRLRTPYLDAYLVPRRPNYVE